MTLDRTRPCESTRGARAIGRRWSSSSTATLPDPIELVSWQIGRAAGRLRARIGPWVDVPAFAALVVPAVRGPAADATVGRAGSCNPEPVHEHWTSRAAVGAEQGCVVMTGTLDPAAAARIEGLVDNLEAAGVPAVVSRHASGVTGVDVPAAAREAGLVVIAGLAPTSEIDALIAARRGAGLTTAVDLGSRDLEPGGTDGDRTGGALTPAAAALIEACDLVISPAGALHTAGAASARRALVLPTLLTRARAAALRDARVAADATGVLVIGWRVGDPHASRPDYTAAVAEGIARILTEHRDRVEIAGDVGHVPAELLGHERVTVVAGTDVDVDAETIARWAVHVWTPALLGNEIVDDARAAGGSELRRRAERHARGGGQRCRRVRVAARARAIGGSGRRLVRRAASRARRRRPCGRVARRRRRAAPTRSTARPRRRPS